MAVGCFDTDEIFIIWSRTDACRSTPSRSENQTSAISEQSSQQPDGKPQTLFNLSPIDWARTHFLNVWLVVVPAHVEEPSAFKLPFIQWIYLLLFPEKRPASSRCVWDRWAREKSVAVSPMLDIYDWIDYFSQTQRSFTHSRYKTLGFDQDSDFIKPSGFCLKTLACVL